MATVMTRERAAAAVAAATTDRDGIQTNLLELDGSFGKRMLAGAALTGESKRRWEAAAADLAALWETFTAYAAVVDQAAGLLAGARRPSDRELAQVTTLLTGTSVEVTRSRPLAADRGRGGTRDEARLRQRVRRGGRGRERVERDRGRARRDRRRAGCREEAAGRHRRRGSRRARGGRGRAWPAARPAERGSAGALAGGQRRHCPAGPAAQAGSRGGGAGRRDRPGAGRRAAADHRGSGSRQRRVGRLRRRRGRPRPGRREDRRRRTAAATGR